MYLDTYKEYEKWRLMFYSPKSTWGWYRTSSPTFFGILKKLFGYRRYYWPMRNIQIYKRPMCTCCERHNHV